MVKMDKIERKIPKWIAGPCSAESRQQILSVAEELALSGKADALRAGVWKPRTRPNSFEGVGERALEWLCEARERTSLPIMCEVATPEHIDKVLEYGLDGVWIGARTTVNPFYVQEIADRLEGSDIIVMVKNPINPDIQLWVGAIERLRGAGLKHIAAIHRGFMADIDTLRNDPIWGMAISLRSIFNDIPIICDPSHIAGRRLLVPIIAQKALDLDMHGLMVEVHPNPETALSDSEQQLTPNEYVDMINSLRLSSCEPTKGEQLRELAMFRSEVDVIDEGLIALLARRMALSSEIGEFKRKNNIKILQINRWQQMLESRLARAKELGLDPQMVKDILELLHKASVDIQSKL